MSQNKNFSRYFIILQESDKGYGLTPNKVPTGYAKVECKNNKCKITFYVQNLKKENLPYYMFLIASKKNTDKLINLGPIKLDSTGRSEVSMEYDQDNISGTNIAFDKISGAALTMMNNGSVLAPLVGFNTVDIPDWKKFKILNMYINEKSNQEKTNKKEEKIKPDEKINYEKYENEIENNKNIDEHKIIDEMTPYKREAAPENINVDITDEELQELDKIIDIEPIPKEGVEKISPKVEKQGEINTKENLLKIENIDDMNEIDMQEPTIDDFENYEDMHIEKFDNNYENHIHMNRDDYDDMIEYSDPDDIIDSTLEKETYIYEDNLTIDDVNMLRETEISGDYDDIINSTLEKESNIYETNLSEGDVTRVEELCKNHDDDFNDGIGEDEYKPFGYRDDDHDDHDDHDKDFLHEEYYNDHDHHKNFLKDDYEYDGDFPKGNVGKFFKDALKDFDKIKNFAPEIKNTKWYRININDLDSLLDDEEHNKYTVAYYPMISYYPYFCKFKHYIMGLKYDEDGMMKYLIYGIPGTKDKYSQPLDGKTGYVIWIPASPNAYEDMGYWLMFYDFRNSTVLIPEK